MGFYLPVHILESFTPVLCPPDLSGLRVRELNAVEVQHEAVGILQLEFSCLVFKESLWT